MYKQSGEQKGLDRPEGYTGKCISHECGLQGGLLTLPPLPHSLLLLLPAQAHLPLFRASKALSGVGFQEMYHPPLFPKGLYVMCAKQLASGLPSSRSRTASGTPWDQLTWQV